MLRAREPWRVRGRCVRFCSGLCGAGGCVVHYPGGGGEGTAVDCGLSEVEEIEVWEVSGGVEIVKE